MADKVIGVRLTAEDGVTPSVKNIKGALREAQAEVVRLTEKFGATSKEVAGVAMYAADLKDKMGDAKSLIDAFNPDTKFRAFGASINTVVGGFTALTGAMGLLGVESEEVQKTLLKVQSALALSQGVAQLQEGIQAFKNFGAVILNTLGKSGLMGIAIAGVAALGAALLGAFDGVNKISEAQKAYNDTLKDYKSAAAEAIQKVEQVKVALSLARAGVISKKEALKTYNDTLGDSIGKTDSLSLAEKNIADKAGIYIQVTGLKAQANALFAISAQKVADAMVAADEVRRKYQNVMGNEASRALVDIGTKEDEVRKAADSINALGSDLLKKAEEIAKKGGVSTTGKVAPSGKVKEKEEEYKFVKSTIRKINDAELEGLQESIKNKFDAVEKAKAFNADLALSSQALQIATFQVEENISNAKIKLTQTEFDARMNMARATGQLLAGLSELFGQQTAAGKVFAVAEATINTYAAIAGSLRAFAGKPIPGYAIVQAIATGIFGLAQVKKILAVQVPGKGSGGSGSIGSIGSVSAPLTPQRLGNQTTTLDQQSLNAMQNATTRAFVLESDVANNRERIRRLNRAARIS